MSDRVGRRAVLLGGAAAIAGAAHGAAPPPLQRRISGAIDAPRSRFLLGCDAAGVTSLRHHGDRFATDYVRAGARLGPVRARIRDATGWTVLDTAKGKIRLTPSAIEANVAGGGVQLASRLAVTGETLRWEVEVTATGDTSTEIGDLLLPLPMHTRFDAGRPAHEGVMKHSFVSGHGSHVFWMRSNSVGPFLLLLPDRDTHLEYWDVERSAADPGGTWCAYVHAAAAAAETRARGTHWRLPVSALTLAPGETRRYGFTFRWVEDYAAARTAIAAAGLVDVEVLPGMTVPADLHADLALASADRIEQLTAEHAALTEVRRLPDRAGRQIWRVRFRQPGENRLTVHQSGGRRTELEFFSAEPLETMIGKRGAFIARRQHRDPARWYDGLFGEWNMETQTLLGPDNYDRIRGWRIYEVTCDDPGLSKPVFLAAKNAEHPVPDEVAALDRYIARFVWGGLQMTGAERYPFAVYGIPDWKQNRESGDPGPKGRLHVWRPYDYPHMFAMYHAMHRIARDHPAIPTALTAIDYLARAAGTAIAMFTVPAAVVGWSGYETGFYNECVIPALVEDLRAAGMNAEARVLEDHWARKVRRFVAGGVDLFGSEYPFDSTGFESTQALARSALDRPRAMGVTRAAAEAFAERQAAANLFCRGWLEPAYYYLGSDYRGTAGDSYTLTYMAQMGGWALLDRALSDVRDPHPLLRIGYASLLSAWALLNSGPATSGHGYWYPGAGNDGGAAGGFEPAPEGTTWLDQPHHRGAWYYSCEIDLGFCGALRGACAIVADDPVFGRTAYGAVLEEQADRLLLSPRDGVRRRLSVRLDDLAADVELLDARFGIQTPVDIAPGARTVTFCPEPFSDGTAQVMLTMRAAGGAWRRVTVPIVDGVCTIALPVPVGPAQSGAIRIGREA